MSMVIRLIVKDIIFAKKWFVIGLGILIALFVNVFIEPENIVITHMMFYLFIGLILQRICYTEDSPEVKTFLKSLPVKISHIVLARYFILFASVALLIVLVFLTIHMQGLPLGIRQNGINIIFAGFVALYYSVFMFLFYLNGFDATKYANTIFASLFFLVGFNVNRGVGLGGMEINISAQIIVIALFVIACLIGLCVYGSIKVYGRR